MTAASPRDARSVLVIRLSAFGDFVQSFGPFAAIRAAHPHARIVLLTGAALEKFARRCPWFDDVLVDSRPAWWNLPGLRRLTRQLHGFDFVYDLQTSARSSRYHVLAGRPGWSGIAPGASHPHANPHRNSLHTVDRQRDQLAMAGVTMIAPDLSWLLRDPPPLALPPRAVLLMPGAAPHRPAKRWPADRFAELACQLAARGMVPAVLGGAAERRAADVIGAACPQVIDLVGRTTMADIATLAARAACAVGNDTGPMHLAATVGCRCVVLFSAASDPALTAPRGVPGQICVIRRHHLRDLPMADVLADVSRLLLLRD